MPILASVMHEIPLTDTLNVDNLAFNSYLFWVRSISLSSLF